MKKFFMIGMVFLMGAALAVPAMAADFKMTWTGSFELNGMYISNDVIKTGEKSADWYYQKLLVEPTFHINDNVRIHNLVTIMERDWDGLRGEANKDDASGTSGNWTGTHNFWWERCYASFPLKGGTLSVGRMSGGTWAHPFMDDEENRDRIKYVKKVGNNVFLGVIEKLDENDGGGHLDGDPDFTNSDSDIDAYAVGAVIPLSKDFIFKPLLYWVNYGGGNSLGAYSEGADKYLTLNGFTFKSGDIKVDAEIDYIFGTIDAAPGGTDTDWKQLLWWIDAAMTKDKTELAIGAWFVQGEESATDNESNNIYGIGESFQPLLILTGREAGLLGDHDGVSGMGVSNLIGYSGMMAYYIRGNHRMNDQTSLNFIWGMVKGDEMADSGYDDDLGMEVDIGVDCEVVDNVTYAATLGYMWTGDYFKRGTTYETDDVYMIQHGVKIEF